MKQIDKELLESVISEARKSPRLRKNYNFHQSLDDKCHRFLNALEVGTEVPIHHHVAKDETFIVLKGRVRVNTYNDQGEVLESTVLSHEDGIYGVDIPKNTWHNVECLETGSVIFEVKEGPFVEHEIDGILEVKTKSLPLRSEQVEVCDKKRRLPAGEGVCLVTKMVKSGYLSKRSSIVYSVLSIAKNRKVVDGKQKAFNAEHILKLNKTIREIAQELLSVRITEESDVLIQLRELRDVVCFPYVFQTIMGKSADWQKLRLSKKVSARKNGREYTMLGKFTSDEVSQINDAIRVIALTLLSIELVSDNPDDAKGCHSPS